MQLAKTAFLSDIDLPATVEPYVRTDSAGLSNDVYLLMLDIHDRVFQASKAIDVPGPFFTWWSRDAANTSWYLRNNQVGGIIPTDGSCP